MATLKEIAEQAGVSIGTVDRIVHNRGRFASETADKVRRIMEEVDYRPNIMARQLSRPGNCRIGAFLPHPEQDSGYWNLPLSGMRRAEHDLEPFGLSLEVLYYDRYNPRSFLKTGQRLLDEDFDGILMAPLRAEDALTLMDRMPPGRPVMFFDTDLPESDRDGYIGQDSCMSGRLGARLISMMSGGNRFGGGAAGDRTRYLIVAPETRNEHLDNRIRGFQEGVGGNTDILRVSVESNHDMPRFRRSLESKIRGHLGGIFVVDASAHFTAEYLWELQGRANPAGGAKIPGPANPAGPAGEHRIPLVGFDLVPENRRWLKEGVIDFLLTQRPAEQGYRGINRLFRKIFLDEDCPGHEYTPIDIVSRENLTYLTEEEMQ